MNPLMRVNPTNSTSMDHHNCDDPLGTIPQVYLVRLRACLALMLSFFVQLSQLFMEENGESIKDSAWP